MTTEFKNIGTVIADVGAIGTVIASVVEYLPNAISILASCLSLVYIGLRVNEYLIILGYITGKKLTKEEDATR